MYVIAPPSLYPGYTFTCVIAPASGHPKYTVSCIFLRQQFDTYDTLACSGKRKWIHCQLCYCISKSSPSTSTWTPRIHCPLYAYTVTCTLLHQLIDTWDTLACSGTSKEIHCYLCYCTSKLISMIQSHACSDSSTWTPRIQCQCMLLHQQLDAQDTLSPGYYCTCKLITRMDWHVLSSARGYSFIAT